MVCLRKPEADPTRNHLPLWRYPAQQGLKLNDDDDDDDDDDDEEEEEEKETSLLPNSCLAR